MTVIAMMVTMLLNKTIIPILAFPPGNTNMTTLIIILLLTFPVPTPSCVQAGEVPAVLILSSLEQFFGRVLVWIREANTICASISQ